MKTILLTGATGFLGSNLAYRLLASGYRVSILKRPSSNLDRLAPILSRLSCYDVADLSAPFKEGRVDAVIHTATCYGRHGETAAEIAEANTVFPLRLLETASRFNTEAFFNTDTFFNTGNVSYQYLNGYVLSKNHFLEWGKQFADSKKIRFVNVRLEHMYGAGDDASKFTTHVIKTLLNNAAELKLTLGEQKRDFIYVDDVVAAYEILLENVNKQAELFQQYELGSGEAITIREFVETVRQLSGASTQLDFGALPYREGEIMHSVANTERLKLLGWHRQTNLVEGVEKAIRFEQKFQG